MKNVIFATDFSRSSHQVSRYALRFAEKLNQNLILLHVNEPIIGYSSDVDINTYIDRSNLDSWKLKKLKNLKRNLEALKTSTIDISYVLSNGDVENGILRVCKEYSASFLIMSLLGSLKKSTMLFGNHATEMIFKSQTPLLLVPPKRHYTIGENILLSIDLEKEILLDPILKSSSLAKSLGSVLNIFSLIHKTNDEKISDKTLQIRKALKDVPHILNTEVGKHFKATFLDFSKKQKADLLIIIHKEQNWFSKLFIESNAESLALKADKPVLIYS